MRPRVRNIIIISITGTFDGYQAKLSQISILFCIHFPPSFNLTLLTKPRVRVVNGYLRPKAPLLGYIRPALANRLKDDDDDNDNGSEDSHMDDNIDDGNNSGFNST